MSFGGIWKLIFYKNFILSLLWQDMACNKSPAFCSEFGNSGSAYFHSTWNMDQFIMHQGVVLIQVPYLGKTQWLCQTEAALTSSQLMTVEFETKMGSPEPQNTNFVPWLFEGVLTDLGLQGIAENAVIFPS